MRPLLALALVVPFTGCQPDCGSPQQLEGPVWQVLGNVVVWETGASGAPPGPSPVNGYTDWSFEWPDPLAPSAVIRIDDQPFDAQAQWSTTECGNFAMAFSGEYLSRTGTAHNFTAAGNFLIYDILIEGALAWNETWEADGTIGTLSASDASIAGRQYAPE